MILLTVQKGCEVPPAQYIADVFSGYGNSDPQYLFPTDSEFSYKCETELQLQRVAEECEEMLCGDTPYKTFFRRLKGAVTAFEVKNLDGWEAVRYQPNVRQGALRLSVKAWRVFTNHVDLRMHDGTETTVPEGNCVYLEGIITKHLNAIGYLGGGWEDKADLSILDNLFSCGK